MHTSIIYSVLIIYEGFHVTPVFLKSWLWFRFRGEKGSTDLQDLDIDSNATISAAFFTMMQQEVVSLRLKQCLFKGDSFPSCSSVALFESDLKRISNDYLWQDFFDSLSPAENAYKLLNYYQMNPPDGELVLYFIISIGGQVDRKVSHSCKPFPGGGIVETSSQQYPSFLFCCSFWPQCPIQRIIFPIHSQKVSRAVGNLLTNHL